MAKVVRGASKAAARESKRRKEQTDTDSDDSDTLTALLEEKDRRKKAKAELKAKQDDEAAILKMLNEQTAKNARRLKELAAARNSYPVILLIIFQLSLTNHISCRLWKMNLLQPRNRRREGRLPCRQVLTRLM
jgi:DNA repair exonuclease SbcCD ATPase subunit